MSYTLQVIRDEHPSSPREYAEDTYMVCWHGRYRLGDAHDKLPFHMPDPRTYESWSELGEALAKALRQAKEPVELMLPLFLYDHSGIAMRTVPFSCRWDSGQVGFIVMTKKQRKQAGIASADVARFLHAEVALYDQYLQGDVWGYVIEDEDGDTVESCWDFYGEEAAQQEGQAVLECLQQEKQLQFAAFNAN